MNYHDYHLRGYTVSDFGRTLTLDLIYDDSEKPSRESRIEFSDVILYHFTHTLRAIILEIDPVSLTDLLSGKEALLAEWDHWYGLPYRQPDDTHATYVQRLQDSGHQAWEIGAAIGFHGFVIGKNVRQLPALAPV